MSGRHAAPVAKRRRRSDDWFGDADEPGRDDETLAWFKRLNQPARVAHHFVDVAVATAFQTGPALRVKQALRMTEAIRHFAQAGGR